MKKIFTTIVMLLIVLAGQATIRYVRTMYPSQNLTGTKWQNAGDDLQGTINASSAGDEVWVLSGPYWPVSRPDGALPSVYADRNKTFLLKAGVKIYGGFSGTETSLSQRTAAVIAANPSILTGNLRYGGYGVPDTSYVDHSYHVVVSAGDVGTATLDGFTIERGNTQAATNQTMTVNGYVVTQINGGGMYCINSSPTLTNITFTNNFGYDGGGMYNENSAPVLTNCVFSGNRSGSGGGIYNLNSPAVFTNVVVSGNYSAGNAGGFRNRRSLAVYTNVTISGNYPNGIENADGSNIKLRNSIIYGSIVNDASTPIIEYSSVQELQASGPGNIAGTNPQFTSPVSFYDAPTTAGNYSLTLCSPAISKGSNTYYATGQTPNLTAVTTDIAGNSRNYNNGVVDMGAYEAQLDPGIFYVKSGASGNGYSWATASGDIQAMINLVCAGTTAQVWVAGGTYKPNRRADATNTITAANRNNAFVLRNNVQVYGGFAGMETLLSQRTATVIAANPSTLSGDFSGNDAGFTNNTENAYHVVISAGAVGTAALDGFTIKGGNANGTGNITVNSQSINLNNGGGMFTATSSPILANTSFAANNATNIGGGLYNNTSSSVVTNCIFSGNAAAKGAGIYNISSPAVFTNTVVSGNKSSGNGGGVYNESSLAVFTNATVGGNSASSGSGMYNATSSNIKLRNSIVFGNLDGMVNSGSTPVIEYSLVQELEASGTGNVDGTTNDAQFSTPVDYAAAPTTAGSYSLSLCSPGINSGSNTYYAAAQTPNLTTITTDLAGNSRFYNSGVVDMGAYELQAINNRPVLYVKAGGTGDGYSWTTASGDIQAMINLACPSGSTQVWVAGGTYKPNRRADNLGTITPADRNNAFLLKNNVNVYGGFAGTETLLSQRNLALTANASILSGDFSGNDAGFTNNDENAYHIVVSSWEVRAAELNGFTITRGNANGNGIIDNAKFQGAGGGMVANAGAPTLANIIFTSNSAAIGGGLYNDGAFTNCSNCRFTANKADNDGGGVYNYRYNYSYGIDFSPVFTNCVFSGNTAANGAGIYGWYCGAVFTNTVISGNKSLDNGGGLYSFGAPSIFTNATISGNSAGSGSGSGMYNVLSSNIKLRNSIVYGNLDGIVNGAGSTCIIEYSLVQGLAASAPGNIDGATDPQFNSPVAFTAAPTTAGDYTVSLCSPAINSGSNAYYGVSQFPNLTAVTTELAGNSRFYYGWIADMGAYEYQGTFVQSQLAISSTAYTRDVTTTTTFGDCNSLVATVAPLGTTSAISGSVTAKVYVQASAPTYNSAPYVRRTYDIRPVANADAATATATLYFLQSDFTDYNTNRGTFPSLPIDATDAAGNRANLRIYQQHGSSTTGNLGSYTGWGGTGTATVDITPTTITYNTLLARWEVTFPVTGFSGFFAHTGTSIALPIKLLSFTANNAGSRNRIDWNTATEDPGTSFEITRSSNGSSFDKIGAAAGKGHDATYTFYDDRPIDGTNYYRLKIVEADGATTFSNVAIVRNDGARGSISVSPVPATSTVTISNTNTALVGTLAIIYDMQGRAVHSFTLSVNNQVNVVAWAAGIYNLRLVDGTTLRLVKQ